MYFFSTYKIKKIITIKNTILFFKMKTENLERVKLDFYGLGKTDHKPEFQMFNCNKGFSDKANNILERNSLSLNSIASSNVSNLF